MRLSVGNDKGNLIVRAELLIQAGNVLREASVVVYLSDLPDGLRLMLPVIMR
ncbi:MAG: hypothetical protein R6X18_12855 [Chloroflexota bacterium]